MSKWEETNQRIKIALPSRNQTIEITRPFKKAHYYPTVLEILIGLPKDITLEERTDVFIFNNQGRSSNTAYEEFYSDDLPRWKQLNKGT